MHALPTKSSSQQTCGQEAFIGFVVQPPRLAQAFPASSVPLRCDGL